MKKVDYKYIDFDLIHMSGFYRDKNYDNREMRKKFLDTREERIKEIDKVLIANSLPTDFTQRDNIKTIDEWVIENAEDNGVSLEANKRNSWLLKEKYILKTRTDLPFEKEKHLTYEWKSILYDLTLKLAETKRKEHLELAWKMQTRAKRASSYKRLCLYGIYDPYSLTKYIDIFDDSSMLESHLIYSKTRILNETRNFVFSFDRIEKAMNSNYPYEPLLNLNRNKDKS